MVTGTTESGKMTRSTAGAHDPPMVFKRLACGAMTGIWESDAPSMVKFGSAFKHLAGQQIFFTPHMHLN
jgi:hypothetical protein